MQQGPASGDRKPVRLLTCVPTTGGSRADAIFPDASRDIHLEVERRIGANCGNVQPPVLSLLLSIRLRGDSMMSVRHVHVKILLDQVVQTWRVLTARTLVTADVHLHQVIRYARYPSAGVFGRALDSGAI